VLRGRRGWGRHHYAAVGVAAALLVIVFGAVTPAVARARQKEAELDRRVEQLRDAMAACATATLQVR
jgi:hypothetical protein